MIYMYVHSVHVMTKNVLLIARRRLSYPGIEKMCGLLLKFYHHHLSHSIDDCRLNVHGLSSMTEQVLLDLH